MESQSKATARSFQHAFAHHQKGELGPAEALYKDILTREPQHFDALHCLGLVEAQRGNAVAAFDLVSRAIATDPSHAVAYVNRGKILMDLKRPTDALIDLEKALAIAHDFFDALYCRGNALQELMRPNEALDSFERALAVSPNHVEALINRGNTLQILQRTEEALTSYEQALAIRPDHFQALIILGDALVNLGRHEQALVSYERALAISPNHTEALIHAGNVLLDLKRYADAVASYAPVLARNPDYPFLFGNWLDAKMRLCDWSGLGAAFDTLAEGIAAGKPLATAFTTLATPLPLPQQRKCAEMLIETRYPPSNDLQTPAKRPAHKRIRLGYFSADFREHPVAHLAAGLFEMHDRSRFELIAFAFGPPARDAMRSRIEAAFDQFIDVSPRSDVDVALLARERGVDIAVDLMGFTLHNRTGIFARRAAPLQVSYLGYAGTMGASYIDYLIGDPTVTPREQAGYYTEKIVYLPHTFQPNDARRRISPTTPDRRAMGLPDQGFVFCSFNHCFKINPDIFDIWMRLLRHVDGSVLWLAGTDPAAERNLRNEAQARGVAPDRLIFKQRTTSLADHLAQLRLADLFLDTLPYNAHATASDALWAGVPVLTRTGETYAGRVAASLLKAVGLPELITESAEAYEALALELATDAPGLAAIRQRLAANRLTQPLFDTALFTRHIEAAYTAMWRRHQAGLPPEQIVVAP